MPPSVELPDSVAGVCASLGEGAVLLAGGTQVMPRVTTTSTGIERLVSLRRAGMEGIELTNGRAVLGAATTLTQLGREDGLAFLHPAVESIASPTIRNLATVGGNLFVEQPYGDLAVALLALDAELAVSGPEQSGRRGVEEVLSEHLEPREVVTAVAFDLPADGAWFYTKAMRRPLNSASIVTVAAVVNVQDGSVAHARIALGGAGARPVRAKAAEAALTGKPLDRPSVESAAEAALQDAQPFDDSYASAWYRRRVLPVHIRRALLGE
jgi:CO/xanthine dehydrogenase FAD-binding subunit